MKGGSVIFFQSLKEGSVFSLHILGVSDILLNLKGEEYNLSPKKKIQQGGGFRFGPLNQNFPFRPTNNGLDLYLGQI